MPWYLIIQNNYFLICKTFKTPYSKIYVYQHCLVPYSAPSRKLRISQISLLNVVFYAPLQLLRRRDGDKTSLIAIIDLNSHLWTPPESLFPHSFTKFGDDDSRSVTASLMED